MRSFLNLTILNKIFNEDCLTGMNKIPDKSIDMILCDLPYGTTKNKWDNVIDLEKLWEQYNRIIKDNGAIVLFAQSPFDKILACSNLKMFRYEWIWEKTHSTGFLNASKCPLKNHENILIFTKEELHENILVFYKKLPTYNPIKTKGHRKVSRASHKTNCMQSSNYGKQMHTKDYDSDERYPASILRFKSDKQNNNLHPTQKPVELLRYLIKTYTNENEIILDNCIGSGSTAVAAYLENRYFIGFDNGTCEKTKKPFSEIAINRYLEIKEKYKLFEMEYK